MSIKSGAYGGIGPLRSQHSSSMNQASPNIPPTPYLDVMSVRNTHIPQDGIGKCSPCTFGLSRRGCRALVSVRGFGRGDTEAHLRPCPDP